MRERRAMNAETFSHASEEDVRNRDILININGELLHRDAAKVSVYDAGFMLGDGMWEGLRLRRGRWGFLEAHMERLYDSCRAAGIEIGWSREKLIAELDRTAIANGMTDNAHCRLMVTRGIKSKPFQHPKLAKSGPTIVILIEHSKPLDAVAKKGVRLVTVPQVRGLPMSQDPKYNSHSKLNCILACLHAERMGADEALMLDPHGFVDTTNACNFFIVKNGALWTSTGDYCMNGITRGNVLAVARASGLEVHERNYSLFETYAADEAFLTGTFGSLTPVASIDGLTIGRHEGLGPVGRKLLALYKALVEDDIRTGAKGIPVPAAAS
jgi:branched-chain amino acid aminotransferase